ERLWRVVAREGADERAPLVQDLERHGRRRLRGEDVVEDRAVRGVLTHGLLGRERRIGVAAPAYADCDLRRVKKRRAKRRLRVELPERRDVVEDPEAAAVRGDDEVVTVNDEIADGRGRHVEAQRLP